MNDIERLLAIEGIKRTKATYLYAMDTKRWELLKSTFTADAIADFRGTRDLKPGESHDRLSLMEDALAAGDAIVVKGDEAIVALIRSGVGKCVTVHQVAAPIIDITRPDSGSAIWPMFDFIDNGTRIYTAYGYYHETYRPEEGSWRIQTLQVTRLRVESSESVPIP